MIIYRFYVSNFGYSARFEQQLLSLILSDYGRVSWLAMYQMRYLPGVKLILPRIQGRRIVMRFETIKNEIDSSLEDGDINLFQDLLIDLVICEELIESKRDGIYPDQILHFLLNKMEVFKNTQMEGGWDLFKTILSGVENFNPEQFALFQKI